MVSSVSHDFYYASEASSNHHLHAKIENSVEREKKIKTCGYQKHQKTFEKTTLEFQKIYDVLISRFAVLRYQFYFMVFFFSSEIPIQTSNLNQHFFLGNLAKIEKKSMT